MTSPPTIVICDGAIERFLFLNFFLDSYTFRNWCTLHRRYRNATQSQSTSFVLLMCHIMFGCSVSGRQSHKCFPFFFLFFSLFIFLSQTWKPAVAKAIYDFIKFSLRLLSAVQTTKYIFVWQWFVIIAMRFALDFVVVKFPWWCEAGQ